MISPRIRTFALIATLFAVTGCSVETPEPDAAERGLDENKPDWTALAQAEVPEPVNESQPGGGIAWSEAADHVGSTQRVCGPLAGTGNSSDDVFLNVGKDYPDPARFTIVIWDIGGVEPIAEGTTVCTSGQITTYEGVAQIELRSAGDVELYE